MKFKRIALFFLIGLLVLLCALPAGAASVHIGAESGEQSPDELRVELSLADCQSMFGVQGSLFYDAGHLEFQNAVSAQGDDWSISVEDLAGELRFSIYSQTLEEPLEGFVPLFIVTFSLAEDTPAGTALEFSSREVIVTDGETEAAALDATFSVRSGEAAHFHDVSSWPQAEVSSVESVEEPAPSWRLVLVWSAVGLGILLACVTIFLLIRRKTGKRYRHAGKR